MYYSLRVLLMLPVPPSPRPLTCKQPQDNRSRCELTVQARVSGKPFQLCNTVGITFIVERCASPRQSLPNYRIPFLFPEGLSSYFDRCIPRTYLVCINDWSPLQPIVYHAQWQVPDGAKQRSYRAFYWKLVYSTGIPYLVYLTSALFCGANAYEYFLGRRFAIFEIDTFLCMTHSSIPL